MMTPAELYPASEELSGGERLVFDLYATTCVGAYVLLMALGLAMRLTQADWAGVNQTMFYEILTMHGAGMIANTALITLAVMWFFLRKYVKLHLWAFATNFLLFGTGTICIVVAVFVGGYAGMWTFLYPLPQQAAGVWPSWAGALFFVGNLVAGFGFLMVFLDMMAGIIGRYGNLARAMGWQWLFAGKVDEDLPVAVVGSTVVIIADTLGSLAGAVALVMNLIVAIDPSITLNALLTKELTYWFGHMIANATIFMGAIAIFELLPRYTGHGFRMNRVYLWAWLVTMVAVIVVVPHHLLMDYAQPKWAEITGQIASYAEGFPVYLETAFFVLTSVYRSGIRWKMPSALIVLSVFGWSAGIVPAMMDGTIVVNKLMHNTQWVPGHFHFYLILGVLPMAFAAMYHVVGSRVRSPDAHWLDKLSVPFYTLGTLIFVLAFLDAGAHSVPRRFAVHIAAWQPFDQAGSIGAMLIILGMLCFAIRITTGLMHKGGDAVQRPAPAAPLGGKEGRHAVAANPVG